MSDNASSSKFVLTKNVFTKYGVTVAFKELPNDWFEKEIFK